MKKVPSFTLATIVALSMISTTVSADIKKGQSMYLKTCKKCHGNGTKGAAMKTQGEWVKAFENEAAILRGWHKGTEAEKYLKTKRFKKRYLDLKDFVWEYASDSGSVPSCG